MVAAMDPDELQRAFFDGLYTNRIAVAIGSIVVVVVLAMVGRRAGWFDAARRHPARSGTVLVVALAVSLPVAWYLASPIWIRTELVEPGPAAVVDVTPSPASPTTAFSAAPASPAPVVTTTPSPAPFAARRHSTGSFRGTDDFHFGRGTATIIETAPGRFTLRLDDFSVRNGPDLYVYLSPKADDYARGALELGKLKATDGAFGYDLPAGVDPAGFGSAIVWCKQFSHLFAVAPLASV
jgi:electron transfer DM13